MSRSEKPNETSFLDSLRLRGFLVMMDQSRKRLTIEPDGQLTNQDRTGIRAHAKEISVQLAKEERRADEFHKWCLSLTCEQMDASGYSPASMDRFVEVAKQYEETCKKIREEEQKSETEKQQRIADKRQREKRLRMKKASADAATAGEGGGGGGALFDAPR